MAHPTAFKYEIGFLNISQETSTATATCAKSMLTVKLKIGITIHNVIEDHRIHHLLIGEEHATPKHIESNEKYQAREQDNIKQE